MKLRKLIFAGILFLISFFLSNFVKGQARIYPGLSYGSEIETLGITLGAEFFISEKFSIVPNLIFFFNNSNTRRAGGDIIETKNKLWELNGDVHYHFFHQENVELYGSGGLNFSQNGFEFIQTDASTGEVKARFDQDDGEVGLNLGVGANFSIGKNFIPFAELKFVVGSTDQIVLSGGLKFGL